MRYRHAAITHSLNQSVCVARITVKVSHVHGIGREDRERRLPGSSMNWGTYGTEWKTVGNQTRTDDISSIITDRTVLGGVGGSIIRTHNESGTSGEHRV